MKNDNHSSQKINTSTSLQYKIPSIQFVLMNKESNTQRFLHCSCNYFYTHNRSLCVLQFSKTELCATALMSH